MQRYNLRLTTEELKTLQNLLEHVKALGTPKSWDIAWNVHLADVMTKIIVTQVEADGPSAFQAEHAAESQEPKYDLR